MSAYFIETPSDNALQGRLYYGISHFFVIQKNNVL